MDTRSKPFRTIVVDGRSYLWEALIARDSYAVTVRSADASGQVLRIGRIPLFAQDMRGPSADGDVEGLIPHMIQAALRRGWQPETDGLPDFYL